MTPTMPLRFRVKPWRDLKGWTQQELADRAGLRRATVADVEANKTRRVDLDTLDSLAGALDVQPSDLLVREDEPKKRGKRS